MAFSARRWCISIEAAHARRRRVRSRASAFRGDVYTRLSPRVQYGIDVNCSALKSLSLDLTSVTFVERHVGDGSIGAAVARSESSAWPAPHPRRMPATFGPCVADLWCFQADGPIERSSPRHHCRWQFWPIARDASTLARSSACKSGFKITTRTLQRHPERTTLMSFLPAGHRLSRPSVVKFTKTMPPRATYLSQAASAPAQPPPTSIRLSD